MIFMKTKEQILEHLSNNGYNPMAVSKILGFLIGAGIKDESEMIYIKANDLKYNWEDFWKWYNEDNSKCEKCPLCDMLNELIEIMEKETDADKVQAAHERYEFLIESFGIDE